MTFTGREALVNVFVVFMMFNIIWWLMCGIWMIRKHGVIDKVTDKKDVSTSNDKEGN
jgi:hypothetical protein